MRRPILTRGFMLVLGFMLLLGFSGLGHVKMKLRDSIALNHFYIVLDSATYKAIEQSPFLRKEFAVTEQRTTKRTDISYTAVYFYGVNTYFEFFDVANQTMGRLGDGGIAFGVDQPGGLDSIKRELGDQLSIAQAPITRQFDQKQVPWFYMAGFSNFPLDSGLRIWAMEYHPRFLAEWNPPSGGKSEGVSRKEVLQRYIAVLKDKSAKPYLKDVVALTIAVNEPTQKRFVELGKLLGYGVRVEEKTTILEGPDIELRILQTDKLHGIQQITMRVEGKPEQAEFRFGTSVLKFHGNELATWSF